ncbi:MAG: sulfatase-like hydrolase/transferase, partial [Pirellulaceae bacterium]
MKIHHIDAAVLLPWLILAALAGGGVGQATAATPKILFILADDLGYGDVACNNPTSLIPTPNIDKLAAEGRRFSEAHSPASVCSPTR